MQSIIIRLATYNDAELIADMSRTTFYDTFADQNTTENINKFMDEQFTKEKLLAEVQDGKNIFLLAFKNEEPVGYAKLRERNIPEETNTLPAMEIARIYSIQKEIGKGVGSALMQKCIELAKDKKKKTIWLGVWQQNARAIDFYKNWGFEICGTQIFKLGDDLQTDWIMRKDLF